MVFGRSMRNEFCREENRKDDVKRYKAEKTQAKEQVKDFHLRRRFKVCSRIWFRNSLWVSMSGFLERQTLFEVIFINLGSYG